MEAYHDRYVLDDLEDRLHQANAGCDTSPDRDASADFKPVCASIECTDVAVRALADGDQ